MNCVHSFRSNQHLNTDVSKSGLNWVRVRGRLLFSFLKICKSFPIKANQKQKHTNNVMDKLCDSLVCVDDSFHLEE